MELVMKGFRQAMAVLFLILSLRLLFLTERILLLQYQAVAERIRMEACLPVRETAPYFTSVSNTGTPENPEVMCCTIPEGGGQAAGF